MSFNDKRPPGASQAPQTSTEQAPDVAPDKPAADSPICPGADGNPYAMPVTQPAPPEKNDYPPSAPGAPGAPAASGNEDPGAEVDPPPGSSRGARTGRNI